MRGAGFYRAALPALLGLAACGRGQPAPDGPAAFPAASPGAAAYAPPPGGDLLGRFIQQLLAPRRPESLRFAKEQIHRAGPAAAPRIAHALRQALKRPDNFGPIVNLCQALGLCGDPQQAGLLLEVVREAPVPVARSAALDALRELEPPGIGGRLAALSEGLVAEPGVRRAAWRALGALGGPEAARLLEREVTDFLRSQAPGGLSKDLWDALLGLRDAGARERLARLQSDLPAGPLAVQCLRARAQAGETGLEAELRAYLDPGAWPAAGVRQDAVAALGEAGAWEDVASAAGDPSAGVRVAVARALSSPVARSAGAGAAALARLAEDPELQVASGAIYELAARGDLRPLEPWLRLVREYPLNPQAVNAIALLKEPAAAHPLFVPLLTERWQACDPEQRATILRALSRAGDPEAIPFFAGILADPSEARELRRLASQVLPNFGAAGLAPLLQHWRRGLEGEDARTVLVSVAELAEQPEARALLLAVLADEHASDAARKAVMDVLPKALGADAYPHLLAARDAAARPEVRAYLDGVLSTYF